MGNAALAAPIVRNLELTGSEDHQLSGQVATARPEETLEAKLENKPKHGEAVIDAATGAFTYKPTANYTGDDTFTVRVSSGKQSARAKVTLHVAAENDAPTASPLQLGVNEDGVVKGQVKASDVDRDILTWRIATPPQHGSALTDTKGTVTYRPAADWHGDDTFTVEVSDGALSTTADVSVKVTPLNDAPLSRAATQACREDEPCKGQVLATDADGDALTYKLVSKPKHGDLSLDEQSGAYTFTAARDFHGEDAFTVDVSDGRLKVTAKLTLSVAAVNDAPIASAPGITTREDEPAATHGKASDIDGDVLVWRVAQPAGHGQVSVDARSGAATYQPAPDYHGADTFTLEVGDGTAATPVVVPVTVTAVNDAPVVKPAALTLEEDAKLEGQVVATDVDGDRLAYAKGRDVAHGELTLSAETGAFVYLPGVNYHGSDSFTVRVSDGKVTTESVVRLAVSSVNDAPVAQPLSLSSNEDEHAYGAASATDVDGDALRWSVAKAPAHGEAKVDAKTGAVTFVPARDYHGPDTFTLSVSDGAAAAGIEVAVTLAPVDDKPFVSALTVTANEDTAAEALLPGGDVDGDALTYRLLSQPKLGAVWASGSSFRFQPAPDAHGDDTFTFDVSDGKSVVQGQVKLHVEPVNDAPVVADLHLFTREDEPALGVLQGFDVDGDPLTWSVSPPAMVDGQGRVTFAPGANQYGAMSFVATASDGKTTSKPARVHVNVAPVNDAPEAKPGRLATDEDTLMRGVLSAYDVDLDAVSYSVSRQPAHGTVKIIDAVKGVYAYEPKSNWSGEDTFYFHARDEKGAVAEGQVSLKVTAVNDPPVAEEDHITAPCLGTVSGRLHGFDRESRALMYRLVSEPAKGRVKLDEKSGEFVYYAEERLDDEVFSFEYVVFDGQASSAPAKLHVHPAGSCRRNNG
ncbi:MAG: tandem-95 repeat protein [Myxococcaceae bacterium]|nr:tandem-95 repeat protein [Myxococcaceae bacterium]